MKILHVITTIERGGAENQLLTLVRHQISLGNQVSVAYLKGSPHLLEEFEVAGARVIRLNHFITSLFSIGKRLSSDFDLAHAHLPRAEIFLSLSNFLNCGNGVLVASRHNSESFFPRKGVRISKWLSRITLSQFSSLIFISRAVESYLRTSGEIPKLLRTKVIYYGFDERISVLTLPANDLKFVRNRYLYVGRLTEQKDIPLLLRAFRRFKENGNSVELHVYGEGKLELQLKKQFQDLSKSIFWHGKTSNISDIMRNSCCLVLPSRYEGFGLVLIEAMQNALPVIAAKNSAIPEVLGEDHPGLFKNEEELTQLLNKVQNSTFRRKILRYQSSRLSEFDPRLMAISVQEFYNMSTRKREG